MDVQQPVIGFFDNEAEAQQAVQSLLTNGFAPEALTLSSQTGITQAAQAAPKSLPTTSQPGYANGISGQPTAIRPEGPSPADPDSQAGAPSDRPTNRVAAASGRFFVSLFGSVQEGSALNHHDIAGLDGTFITVLVQSVVEAGRATDLLNRAGGVTG